MDILGKEKELLALLVRRGLLEEDQARAAAAQIPAQRQFLKRRLRRAGRGRDPDLVEVLLSMNLESAEGDGRPLTEEAVMRAVAAELGLPFKKLDPLDLDLDIVTRTIPRSFAVKRLLLPFAVSDGVIEIALCDPANLEALKEIERVNKVKTRPYISTAGDIRKILAEFFGFQKSISEAETTIARPDIDLGNLEQYVRIDSLAETGASDHHIKSAVDHLFNYAFDQRASDIHIEPKRKQTLVRLRIDGVLHTIYQLPGGLHGAIVSRIKTMSRLDIAEKRRPQDGRIKIEHEGKEAEIRVSTVPVAFGEKVVMRILDPDVIFKDLDSLGFSGRDRALFEEIIAAPHGIFLVTGPTGSGKSTTLYSTLKRIATPEKNVVTVEDPVEMVHEEFNQIAVQPAVGVTFGTILRNILRQDPDIIMIGEIRDLDTAENAIQAALTGHLVFSTLHNNDAVSAITRLIDIGAAPFLVGSTLIGAMAQRLVRTICPHCRERVRLEGAYLRDLGFPVEEDHLELARGRGCRQCRDTGYIGRCGIFEIFQVSDEIQRLVAKGASEAEIREQARREGMTTLREDAWSKVLAGRTTVEEVLRVTGTT
jgi:general secretion pathway protein E